MKSKIISFIVLLTLYASCFAQTLDYNGLFDDLKKYKKEAGVHHAGHLYEHMLWVAKSMAQLYDNNSVWIVQLMEERELMIIAAFMHDIGKAGDLQYLYTTKPEHPQAGVDYFLKIKPYKLNEQGDAYNFDQWVQKVGLTDDQVKTLVVLIGMHQEFGLLLRKLRKDQALSQNYYDYFINRLEHFVAQAKYNNGIPDEKIIRMSCALSRADFEGMFPVDNVIKDFPDLPDHPQTLQATPVDSVFRVDLMGPLIMELLINHFKTKVYAFTLYKDKRVLFA